MARNAILAASAVMIIATSAHAQAPIVPAFDALLGYTGKPETAALGMRKIHIISRNTDQTSPPNEASVRAQVIEISKTDSVPMIVFDIETPIYPLDIRVSSKSDVDKTLAYFGNLIDWTRSSNPSAKVGFYGVPITDYWVTNLYNTSNNRQSDPWWVSHAAEFKSKFADWQNANAYLAPIMARTDAVFPSLYTPYEFYESSGTISKRYNGWKEAAFLSIAEAKKYGKDVYPFIWPQFHPGGPYKDYRYLPADYWENEIVFLRKNADGMVLWGWGGFLHESWTPDASWWKSTVMSLAP